MGIGVAVTTTVCGAPAAAVGLATDPVPGEPLAHPAKRLAAMTNPKVIPRARSFIFLLLTEDNV
jgi:hypothetical protein